MSISVSLSLCLSLSLSRFPLFPSQFSSHKKLLHLSDQMRQYFTQMRQEVGQRIVERVFQEEKPSKVYKHLSEWL